MKSMKFGKKTTKRNVYPNKYKISYTNFKGENKTTIKRGLTADEAIIRFRSNNISAKNVSAKLIRE